MQPVVTDALYSLLERLKVQGLVEIAARLKLIGCEHVFFGLRSSKDDCWNNS